MTIHIIYVYVHICTYIFLGISSIVIFLRDYTQMLLGKSPVRLEFIPATCEDIKPQKVDLGWLLEPVSSDTQFSALTTTPHDLSLVRPYCPLLGHLQKGSGF